MQGRRTPTLQATTTLGGGRRRSGTSFFLWASLCSEPMSACPAALALGGGGIVQRIASPQAPALSSALGGSLVIVILSLFLMNPPDFEVITSLTFKLSTACRKAMNHDV
eukprot:COSAG06_NODE_724_length_12795_cov_16.058129_9_plen_109_part_00